LLSTNFWILPLRVPVVDFHPERVPSHERTLVAHDEMLGAGATQSMVHGGVRTVEPA
tara:strand:+ start:701 stop:871 length:171 start_codon:yes stop_codon:yes gene_type:complete